MDKNTDERVVVIDRQQFDRLCMMARAGARESNIEVSFRRALRHVYKFNPHVRVEESDTVSLLTYHREQAQLARYWWGFDTARTVYLRGEFRQSMQRPQLYLMPVSVVGRADLGHYGVVVEFQTHDDYQRAAFLSCMRARRTYPRHRTHFFNGHPVHGGNAIFFDGSWSRRQHGKLLRGQAPKLYFSTEATALVESIPDGYQPASGLFQGMYFLPT